MKYLLLLIIFAGCSKSDSNTGTCYICETSGFSGTGGPAPYMKKEVCTNKPDTISFYDSQGNALQHTCREK